MDTSQRSLARHCRRHSDRRRQHRDAPDASTAAEALRRRLIPAAALLLVAGCSGSETPAAAASASASVEDGVEIISNTTRTADSLAWSIDTIPVVSIGVSDGDPNYIIGRLAGYLRRPDGTILIGDGISSDLRLYDAQGTFVRTVGRAGDGPGEYRVLAGLLPWSADSILVVDFEGSRITVLDPALNYIRRFQAKLADSQAPEGMSSDGVADSFGDHLLMTDYPGVCNDSRGRDGFCQDSVDLFRTTLDGVSTARYGRFLQNRTESVQVARGFSTSWGEPHPQAFWDVHNGRLYYADAKRFEYRIYSSAGAPERIVRAPAVATKYERADVFPKPRSDDETDERIREANRRRVVAQKSAVLPDSFPQFSDMLVDSLGYVWLREYHPAGRARDGLPRWFVFDPDGRLAHTVRVPWGLVRWFAPWNMGGPQIGEDYILTGRRDADGVASVVMYRLRRGGAQP